MLRKLIITFMVGALFCSVYGMANASFVPKNGFVPNADTAVQIAEAVLIPIYGETLIKSERPFHARLDGDVWTVTGTLQEGVVGGVATIRISKKDGTVLSVIHGR